MVVPGPFDVLLGRGRLIQEHLGNLRYRQMIDEHKDQYDSASKLEKTNIAKKVVQLVQASQGRFLKRDEGEDGGGFWIEVDDETAREKVSHSFRNRRLGQTGGAGASHTKPIPAVSCSSSATSAPTSSNRRNSHPKNSSVGPKKSTPVSSPSNSHSNSTNNSNSDPAKWAKINKILLSRSETRDSDDISFDSKRARMVQGDDSTSS